MVECRDYMATHINALPSDVQRIVMKSSPPAARLVCREWKHDYDAALRDECELNIHSLLRACKVRVCLRHVPTSWCLRYKHATRVASSYECGRCGRHIPEIVACTCHWDCSARHAIGVIEAMTHSISA